MRTIEEINAMLHKAYSVIDDDTDSEAPEEVIVATLRWVVEDADASVVEMYLPE